MFPQSTHDCRRRAGFTLIELLMVLAIIGILIGLLVPVIAGAYRKGKEAAEFTEITSLAGALQKFKDRYGVYPPSQIVLREDGTYTVNLAPFVGQNTAVFDENLTIRYLRRIWPELVLDLDNDGTPGELGDVNGDGTVNANDFYDWNQDGVQQTVPWYLQGDECLVFFLGGLPTGQYLDASNAPGRPTGNYEPKKYPPGTSGFGKTPRWSMQPVVPGAGRDGPFFDMQSDRLVDRDNDSFWELIPFRKPSLEGAYAYFSAYEGDGYRPDDLNLVNEPAPNKTTNYLVPFAVTWNITNLYPQSTAPNQSGRSSATPYYIQSAGPNPYTNGASVPFAWSPPPATLPNSLPASGVWVVRYHKPDGFQIISPGSTVGYGHGADFPLDENQDNRDDNDNLTNFSGGPLQDGK